MDYLQYVIFEEVFGIFYYTPYLVICTFKLPIYI